MIVWGVIALIVQVLAFVVVRKIFPAITSNIPANQASEGLFLGVVSLVAGILNAACITY
jgi:putative membrane protein